ncbi:unnamed protein product, partial [Mycena citricolor]
MEQETKQQGLCGSHNMCPVELHFSARLPESFGHRRPTNDRTPTDTGRMNLASNMLQEYHVIQQCAHGFNHKLQFHTFSVLIRRWLSNLILGRRIPRI